MRVLDNYIEQILKESTPQAPIWDMEKILAGKPSVWNYIDGCMIKAMLDLYEITGNERYLTFADNHMGYYVQDDGTIKTYDMQHYSLDDVNPGKALFPLYRYTGKEKYRKGIETINSQLKGQPRTVQGSFWHKNIYPHQIWLDGLYMAQPFYMEYEKTFNNCQNCADSYNQFITAHNLLKDKNNGLYYHAIDTSKQMFWCDPVTGLSQCSWLRALGWFAMALIDTCEVMPATMQHEKQEITSIFCQLIDALLAYQSEDGRWYQVVNFGGIEPNYLETSGSAILAYAIMKATRLNMLDSSYFAHGEKAFNSICSNCLSELDSQLQLDGICLVAGLGNTEHREGTFDYYMREPIVKNEGKGIAPLIMAYTEILWHKQLANQ